MDQIGEKLTRYDRRNNSFRKAYIRERLADIKREREAFSAERDRIGAELTEGELPQDKSLGATPTYSGDNPLFRKAYIRDRMQGLKDEREALIAERNELEVKLASQRVTSLSNEVGEWEKPIEN